MNTTAMRYKQSNLAKMASAISGVGISESLSSALGWEVFEQTDAFFDEACRAHDQSPLKLSNVVLPRPAGILKLNPIPKRSRASLLLVE